MSKLRKTSIVTLLTDFGTEDGYGGAMKGVILRDFPDATVVDISHDIQPFNYRQAAFSLMNYAFYFPAGTIHLVVVDPGVGSSRNGLIIKTSDYYFIGPDNGVFSYIYESKSFEAWKIREELFGEQVSPTFYGRDIFAPAAVRLLQGESPGSFCESVEHLHSFYQSYEVLDERRYRLKVIHVDHFGNLILNFTIADWIEMGRPSDVKIQIEHSFFIRHQENFFRC